MSYKKSMFNIEFKTENSKNVILYNTLSTALGIMNPKTQEIYEKIEEYGDNCFDDKYTKNEVEVLKTNGFIVKKDDDEYLKLKITGEALRYDKSSLSLTIAPTMDCNMACPYCYEKKSKMKMSEEIKKDLIEFIKKRITVDKISFLAISWYGGEPILEFDTIVELSKTMIELCKANNVEYSADIVSNGSLLDTQKATILKEKCNVNSAQITIDGLPDEHNKRRILKNGEDSFGCIVKNIDEIKEILNISIRINVDRNNIQNAENLIDFFLEEKQWGNKVCFYFAPVQNIDEKCGSMNKTCYTYKEFGEINSNLLRKIYKKGFINIVKALLPKPTSLFCAAITTNSYVVDPQGYLYTCWNNVGLKEKSIGTLKDGTQLNKEYIGWLSLEHSHKCKSCSYLPMCHGGCPYDRLKNNSKSSCIHNTISIKENILIEYEEYILQKCSS